MWEESNANKNGSIQNELKEPDDQETSLIKTNPIMWEESNANKNGSIQNELKDPDDQETSFTKTNPIMWDESNANENGSIQNELKEPDEQETSFTRTQKLTLLSVVIVSFTSFASFSVMAPFFPVAASKKGASDTVIGLIFGLTALVMFVASPFLGKFLPHIGAKRMYLAGIFTCASCDIIFGFVDRIPDTTQFIAVCFLVRLIEAFGAAAAETASFAIIARTFPNNLATIFSVVEIFIGLGLMVGPPLGGYLYSVGGYTLPFVALGGCTIVIVLCIIFILPPQTDGRKPESGSLLQFLRIPSTIVTGGCVLLTAMALAFLDPTLAKHVQKYNVDEATVGLMFLTIAGTYTISTFFWGWLTDKKNISKLLMIIGNIGVTAAFLYLGPSPLLATGNTDLWMVILALVLLGLSVACTVVPTFHDIVTTAMWYGMPDNFGTYGVVSGIFTSLFSLGSFIGPTAGGALVEAYGFEWACTVLAAVYLSAAFVLMLFCLWEYQCGKGRRLSPYRRAQAVVIYL